MTALRILAVDDEPLALQRLDWCLNGVAGFELVGKAKNVAGALEMIESRAPDIVLLDIEMPGASGLELAERLAGEPQPAVIFVTAFDEFAVRAFELNAIDYLLKPIEQSRLVRALERARHNVSLQHDQAQVMQLRATIEKLRASRRLAQEKRYETELWIREGEVRLRIPVHLIDRLEADGDYVRLHMGARQKLMRAKLGELESRLDPAQFVRIHRGEIVRHELIESLRQSSTAQVMAVLANGLERPVSKGYLQGLQRTLGLRSKTPAS